MAGYGWWVQAAWEVRGGLLVWENVAEHRECLPNGNAIFAELQGAVTLTQYVVHSLLPTWGRMNASSKSVPDELA